MPLEADCWLRDPRNERYVVISSMVAPVLRVTA